MAAREFGIEKQIINKQPDTQTWVSSFQELHTFAVFSTRGIRIWHYNIY